MSDGAVYVQTNEQDNRVVAFGRAEDGSLTEIGSYATGGAGDGQPHLTSQGSVVLTGDGSYLLVTNASSDDVTVYAVGAGGALESMGRTPSGPAPKSVAEHDGLVYVLNTGAANLTGFRLGDGGLKPIAGGERSLSGPVPTEPRSASHPTARPSSSPSGGRTRSPCSPSTPTGPSGRYRRWRRRAHALRVRHHHRRGPRRHRGLPAQKGAAAASSYSVDGATVTPVTASVGNGRSEICWAVVTKDGRIAFTTNFADGAVTRYGIGPDGALALEDATAGLTVDGRVGLRDLGLTGDGRFLYAVDADSGSVYGWAVGEGGSLTPAGSTGGLPATVAGLAAG